MYIRIYSDIYYIIANNKKPDGYMIIISLLSLIHSYALHCKYNLL